ncbi:MAG: quinone oxidoreductase family protein [Myxococcota bacterium]
MRAVISKETGGADVLKLEEQPAPEPKEHDLLVEVHATSVNPVDIKVRSSGAGRSFPLILGYDVSGVVVDVGARVQGFRRGDEVYGCPNLFGNGANADLALLDSRACAKKPTSVDHATAASLPLVGLTAWESLHDRARIHAGQTILIHAGAGGVGHIAVQLARLHGCHVLTTAGRGESVEFCREALRADDVIDYNQTDFVARVREISNGVGLPVVFDTVGDDVFQRSIDCVAPCGTLVTILGSTPGDRSSTLLFRSISVHYEFMGARVAYGVQPEEQGGVLRSLAKLVDRGLLRPHVSQRLPLERVADGHRQVETGHTIGKVAITVRETR